ncbi:hypothetical protein VVR26_02935 [Corynebacterium camporealensis]|uniref:hypothetical protein n=1 Tax=Corynebacterium camporealensis TaxID=161896 RepID=UPI0034CD8525
MKISVIGCGYLGAVHAACMASLGHEVIGIDVDASRVAALNAGRPPFYEPGFPEVLGEAQATGRLRFAMNTDPGVIADADAPGCRWCTVGVEPGVPAGRACGC